MKEFIKKFIDNIREEKFPEDRPLMVIDPETAFVWSGLAGMILTFIGIWTGWQGSSELHLTFSEYLNRRYISGGTSGVAVVVGFISAIMVYRRIPKEAFPRPTPRQIIVNVVMLSIITTFLAFFCAAFSGDDGM
ncbi:MAG: hypothetical protein ABIY70_12910 [Capsulimonas sp.]|uniref:hypothetical protein n=1 Tax=Capsulimonas sp. TaxID=2494211 RepID=UPI0032653669